MRFILSMFFLSTVCFTVFLFQADKVRAGVTPSVKSVYISASAGAKTDAYPGGIIDNLSAGGTRTIHINGVVEDLDGRDDIDHVEAVFYRSGATGGSACTADKNDCYQVSTCALTNNEDLEEKEYNCQMDLEYYTDATDEIGRFSAQNWLVYVKVVDTTQASGTDNSLSKEIQTVLSLSIPSSIDYGNLSLGQSTVQANNVEMVITQQGNDQADVEVSASSGMTCDSGAILTGNQEWALSDLAYNQGTDLSDVAVETNLDVNYRDDDATAETKTLYWNIGIPENSVGGDCNGTVTITTISQ